METFINEAGWWLGSLSLIAACILIVSFKKTAARNPYPEILKFCDWFQKRHEEKGLLEVSLLLRNPLGIKSSLPDSGSFDPKDLANWLGARVTFTPVIVDKLRDYVASCSKTEAFDYFEKVCAEFNHIEDLIERGETKPPPSGLF